MPEQRTAEINSLKAGKVPAALLILLLCSLPFEYLLTFEIFGFTAKLSYVVSIVLIIYYLWRVWRRAELPKSFQLSEILALLFAALAFLTSLWSIDQKRSLIISAMYLLMALLFIAVRRLLKWHEINFLSIFFWLGLATSAFALWQFVLGSTVWESYALLREPYQRAIFGFPRVQSTFLEPLYFANFLAIPLFIAVGRFWKDPKVFNGLSLVLMEVVLFLTLSRGAVYAFLLSFGLLIIFLLAKKQGYWKIIILSGSIFLAVIVAMGMVRLSSRSGTDQYLEHLVQNEVLNASERSTFSQDITTRSYTIPLALEIAPDHLFGLGAGAFGALPEFVERRAIGSYQTVNNLYLETLVEIGVAGLLCLLFFLGGLFYRLVLAALKSWRQSGGDPTGIFLTAAFLMIFAQYATFSTFYIAYVWVFLAVVARWSEEVNEK